MRVTEFFKDVLQAPLRGRWSTGGVDHTNKRVYLSITEEQTDHRKNKVYLYKGERITIKDHGLKDRVDHIKLANAGYAFYGVMTDYKVSGKQRTVKVNTTQLLLLDNAFVKEDNNSITAALMGKIDVPVVLADAMPKIDMKVLERANMFELHIKFLTGQRDDLLNPVVGQYHTRLRNTQLSDREGRKQLVRVLRQFPKSHGEYGEMRFSYFEKFCYGNQIEPIYVPVNTNLTKAQRHHMDTVFPEAREQMCDYLLRGAPVFIATQNEVSEAGRFSIHAAEDPQFWIDCADAPAEAEKIIAELGLKLIDPPNVKKK